MNPELPLKLEDIINKALEKDRNLRYQGAAEMRTDLQRLKRDTESGRSSAAGSPTGQHRGIPNRTLKNYLRVSEHVSGRARTPKKVVDSGGTCGNRRGWLCNSGSPLRLSLAASQSLGDRPAHERWYSQIFSRILRQFGHRRLTAVLRRIAVCFARADASLHFGWRNIGDSYTLFGEPNRGYIPGPVFPFSPCI